MITLSDNANIVKNTLVTLCVLLIIVGSIMMIRSQTVRDKVANLSLQCIIWRDHLMSTSSVEVESLAQSDHISREIHA